MTEFDRGKEIGALQAEIRDLRADIQQYTEEQRKWNSVMEERVRLAEQWIQTTTGKVVILTTIFGIVGSVVYIFINWFLSHLKWR